MFATWMRLLLDSTFLGLEAQRVIMLSMFAMAAGGFAAQAEAQRMIIEKLLAWARVSAMLAPVGHQGLSFDSIVLA
jgi:hypothetical protein